MLHLSQRTAGILRLLTVSLIFGCRKEEPPTPPRAGITLEILKGDKQLDTIGHVAHDSVVVRVRQGGRLVPGYTLHYAGTSCLPAPAQPLTALTDERGQARFTWRLSGDAGPQQMSLRLLDSVGVERATATISATAVRPGSGWHPAACFPGSAQCLAQQPDGRLWAGLAGVVPYYSTDNGMSWQPQASFPKVITLSINKILPVGAAELLVLGNTNGNNPGDGVYYSGDNGQTWQARSAGLPADHLFYSDLFGTRAGRLLVSSERGGLSASSDKGLTWTPVLVPQARSPFTCISEAPNGDLYLLDYDDRVFRSANQGATWQVLSRPPVISTSYLYADPDNGDLYLGTNAGLYRSTSQGASWDRLFPANLVAPHITQIFKARGAFYFTVPGPGLVRTTDFSHYDYLTRTGAGVVWGGWFAGTFLTANGTLLTNGNRSMLGGTGGLHYNLRP